MDLINVTHISMHVYARACLCVKSHTWRRRGTQTFFFLACLMHNGKDQGGGNSFSI